MHRDVVLALQYLSQAAAEPAVTPELVGFLVHPRTPVFLKHIIEVAGNHRADAAFREPFCEIADEGVLEVVDAFGTPAVQLADALTRPLSVGEFFLQGGDPLRSLSETFEWGAGVIEALRAGGGGDGDEVVRADIQGCHHRVVALGGGQ
ncbi:hypothetical protein [Natrinema sp. 1APR25-10V2]|uniref:hypothetical protein n=1 Tax=Natrinema sp. 1APR25-10V2 TaxID=2951081 RepID=UPI00287468F5|nr:hypothetical protein [Natrinema sp. 1APR25-10V2]MDS0477180.1 hypothetical protein [Natrinema sp. 1APR25-10V2]